MKVGLFFGSFNPIHIGHLIIANTVAESGLVDQVWLVVSPQNPFKAKGSLLHEQDRLDMVKLAIAYNSKLKASDIEFKLPQPNYTATTMAHLCDKFREHEFKIIMGGDNLDSFTNWKNADFLLKEFGIIVYPRPGSTNSELLKHPNVFSVEAPLMDISATFIRSQLKAGKSIRYLVPEDVINYIKMKKLYID